jgi:hypothetical protein
MCPLRKDRCNSGEPCSAKGQISPAEITLINVKTLCLGCHLFWWHKDPVSAGEWFVKTYPERWEQLQILKDTAPKVNIKELIEELRAQWRLIRQESKGPIIFCGY